ncbi:MAG: hypothetical protein PHP03_03230 [Candidatus Pacebacteria bacterium]|nr:hypothetical protein [Candidatus Paceibacterota bacterium]
MTIIQPNKAKRGINPSYYILGAVLICSAFSSIYLYNQKVNFDHSIRAGLKSLQTLQVANSDYKNRLYHLKDAENIKLLAKGMNLVQDKAPTYIESGARGE